MPRKNEMSQSKAIDPGILEAAGDIQGALQSVLSLIKKIEREAQNTGGIRKESLAERDRLLLEKVRLESRIEAQRSKREAREELIRLKKKQDQQEKYYYQHGNIFQKIRDFTGHATQRGYIDYAASLLRGNVTAMDFERLGGALKSVGFEGIGGALAKGAFRAAGPAALAGAAAYKAFEIAQEVQDNRIRANRAWERTNEELFNLSRAGGVAGGVRGERLASIQKNMMDSAAARTQQAIDASIMERLLHRSLGIFPGEAEAKGAETAAFNEQMEIFAKRTGIRLRMDDIRKQVEYKVERELNIRRGLPGKAYTRIRDAISSGAYTEEAVEEEAIKMAENQMKTILERRKKEGQLLDLDYQRKIEISRTKLYNDAVAEMEITRWCQWNPY